MSFFDIPKVQGLSGLYGMRDSSSNEHADNAAQGPRNRPPESSVEVATRQSVDAGKPPVDATRVAEIRTALRDGSYPIVPAKIADAMIAAKLMLSTGQ